MTEEVEGEPGAVALDLRPWQQEALAAWRSNASVGVVEAVTGAGKTRLGLHAISDALTAGSAVVVLVPTVVLLRQWASRIRSTLGVSVLLAGDGHSGKPTPGAALVSTVHTASRWTLDDCDVGGLLIADEVHRYGAPTFAAALRDVFETRLGLTATYERSDDGLEERLKPYFGGEPVFSLGYQRALSEGVIAPFRVAVIPVQLGPRDQERYDIASKKAGKLRYSLVVEFGVPPAPFGEFMAAVATLAKSDGRASITARRFLKAFSDVQKVIAENQAKQTTVERLAPVVRRAGRTLIFSSTIRGARLAADALSRAGEPTGLITSNQKSQTRAETLKAFEAGRVPVVSAPLVLDEGVDVPEADLAIVVASSRSRRQMIQRLGRVLRIKPDGSHAKFILLVAAGTTEDPARGAHEEFLSEMLEAADAVRAFPGVEPNVIIEFLLEGASTGKEVDTAPSVRSRESTEVEEDLRAALSKRGPLTTVMLARILRLPASRASAALESGPFRLLDRRWHLEE